MISIVSDDYFFSFGLLSLLNQLNIKAKVIDVNELNHFDEWVKKKTA